MKRVFSVVAMLLIMFCLAEVTSAGDIQTVTNLNDLAEIVNSTWIDHASRRLNLQKLFWGRSLCR